DMDAFFAAVEQKRNPELKDKPVVIGGSGDPTKRGVVSTANYEARKYGIHSAMPLITAYKLCPRAVFLPVDMDEYARVSEIFKDVLRKFSPVMEDVGIDEAFLDLTAIDEPSEQVAREIKAQISAATGLTCSIGIAGNKLIAKIASDMQKPDGLTIISENDMESRIWPLPVRKLWGVGPKTEAYLKKMAINTIGELAAVPLERLIEHFGNSYGHYLYEASRGIDDNPLVTHWEPKSISRETTFQVDTSHWQTIAKNLADLTRETVAELREREYRCRNVTVKIRFNDFKTHTRATTLDNSADNLETIRKAAFYCLGNFDLKQKKVRLVGVRLGSLTRKSDKGDK
ncbi:MAG TPA: DNA polymerase IV, partial [Dissulfurispiraceae bacterium]